MTEFASLQPNNRDAAEVELERAGTGRIAAIPNPIRDMDDAAAIPEVALPFLAWGRAAGLWDDTWPTWKKRRLAQEAVRLRQRGGTLPAIEGWLSFLDAEVVDRAVPPAGAFATRSQTPEERAEWLSRFAQLRIHTRFAPGPGDPGSFYAVSGPTGSKPASFVGHSIAVVSSSRLRYGRRAVIWDHGDETEVIWSTTAITDAAGVAIPVDRVVVPGQPRAGEAFVGRVFATASGSAGAAFAEPLQTTSRILTLDAGELGWTAGNAVLSSGSALHLQSTLPERVSERGETSRRVMFVGGFVGSYVGRDTSLDRYYERYYLFDASRSPARETTAYGTFVGYTRVGIEPFTARIRVRMQQTASRHLAHVGGFVGSFAAQPSNRLTRIAEAVRAGKAGRDRISITAQTMRTRRLSDGIPLDGSYRVGDLITIPTGREL